MSEDVPWAWHREGVGKRLPLLSQPSEEAIKAQG